MVPSQAKTTMVPSLSKREMIGMNEGSSYYWGRSSLLKGGPSAQLIFNQMPANWRTQSGYRCLHAEDGKGCNGTGPGVLRLVESQIDEGGQVIQKVIPEIAASDCVPCRTLLLLLLLLKCGDLNYSKRTAPLKKIWWSPCGHP